jgi:hypothetical protein
MATYVTQSPGNTALQEEVWTLTLAEAKAVLNANLLDVRKGTYWESNFLKPYRRAARAKADTLRLYTAHFSTGELSNVLCNAGVMITHERENV